MKKDLEPAKNVIRSFLSEIEAVREMQCNIPSPTLATSFSVKDRTPDFNANEFVPQSDDSFEKEKAYILLFAEPWHYRALMHRPKLRQVSEYYQQPALGIYDLWQDSEKEVFYRGCIIPRPEKVTLLEYLYQLASMITEGTEDRAVWQKSLRSFLQFIRKNLHLDEQGTLEVIFPYEMKFKDGYSLRKTENGIEKIECKQILRIVDEEIYPIDILSASDILQNLAHTVLNGRTNSQHIAAEALGYALLCHAIGICQLMTLTKEKIILKSLLTSLKHVKKEGADKYFQPEYYIAIKTYYGPVDVPISHTLHDFLIALPRAKDCLYIFTKPLSSLLRTLYNKGIAPSARAAKQGKITFRTFTSQPLESVYNRLSSMKTISQPKKK